MDRDSALAHRQRIQDAEFALRSAAWHYGRLRSQLVDARYDAESVGALGQRLDRLYAAAVAYCKAHGHRASGAPEAP